LAVLLMAAVMLSLSGCYRQYVMKSRDMYIAPATSADGPEAITIVRMEINPALHLSEGGNGRDSWSAIMLDKSGEETRLLATLTGEVNDDCKRILAIIIDKSLYELEGNRLGYFNHSGTAIYNVFGQGKELKSIYFKLKPEEYSDHLFTISRDYKNVAEIKKGTPVYDKLFEQYKEVNMALGYIYKHYRSAKTQKELEEIAFKDTVVYNLIQYLGSDLYLYITTGITLQEMVLVAGVMKLMKLPSIFGDKINKEGYSEFQPNSGYVAEMFFNGFYDYGVCIMQKAMAAERKVKKITSNKITEEQRQIINIVRDNPCANAETVSAYNACAKEYMAKHNSR